MSDHPYRDVADYQFWSRAMTWAPPGAMDPVVATRFQVAGGDRVGTMGSCFAQHLSRHLTRLGYGYYVAEQAPDGLTADEASARQYGVFSARYGNVYTVRQALQLFERAFGRFVPSDGHWTRGDVFVDPFRPLVEPDGFGSVADLERSRDVHLAATRDVFTRSDVLVFTLGLTEAWRCRDDGSVVPAAPGVSGGEWDPTRYEFVNFGIDDVRRDLATFCESVRSVNPEVRILLTVSPVPLIATYEPRHVLVSTTVSKSILRIAAEDALGRFPYVDYFPSFEIISAASAVRNYYGDDLREVEEMGVAHVMRSFAKHYVEGRAWQAGARVVEARHEPPRAVVCDEETIAAAIDASR